MWGQWDHQAYNHGEDPTSQLYRLVRGVGRDKDGLRGINVHLHTSSSELKKLKDVIKIAWSERKLIPLVNLCQYSNCVDKNYLKPQNAA